MFSAIHQSLIWRQLATRRLLNQDRRLRKFLRRSPDFQGTKPRALRLRLTKNFGCQSDVLIRWQHKDLIVLMNEPYALHLHHSRESQLFAVIVWMMLAGPKAEHITFNLSDGETPSTARFAYSGFDPQVKLLPDSYFFETNGFRKAKEIAASAPAWADRSDEIVWRGAALGTGVYNANSVLKMHPSVIQRIRLAHLAKNTEVDFAFVPHALTEGSWQALLRAGLTGERIPEETWATRKFAIDVDGVTNTWSNLIVRLAFGCCVFKVESQFGYRQWYYDHLIPWQHYIPVKADLSDLFDQIAWAKANQSACAEIARNGQDLANSMTYESESAVAATTLRAFWDGKEFDDEA